MEVFFSESDWDSLSESTEGDEELEFQYGGQASNLLSNLEQTIGKIDDFLSFERGFLPGDIVSRSSNPSGQTGRIVNVDMVVDLETPDGKTIRDVNSSRISKIRSVSASDYVALEHWLGRVDRVIDSVTVVFDDGTVCDILVTDQETATLVPVYPNTVDDVQYQYYPGQRVRVTGPTVSKHWLCGNWKATHEDGTVCAVKAGVLYINWLGSALNSCDSPPPRLQDLANVSVLSCFSHSNWQLGDWCVLHRNKAEIFVVAKTKTTVDVVWQDGTRSLQLDSQSVVPVNIVDSHEFWPHQFVVESGSTDEGNWGVVKSVEAKEKTVKVKWSNVSMEETVSAYEIIEHPDFSFCLGDIVFRAIEAAREDGDSYSSCIGNVVGFKDGVVEVKWATGRITNVAPYEILRCEKCEGSAPSPPQFDENAERFAQLEQSSTEIGKELLQYCATNQVSEKNQPRSAIGFLTGFVSNLFGSSGSTSEDANEDLARDSANEDLARDSATEDLARDSATEVQSLLSADELVQMSESSSLASDLEVEEIPEDNNNVSESFKKFDVVTDCSDHFFFDKVGKGSESAQVNRNWFKKVQQEWSSLQKNLPETIFVRVYEERMDLLRAAIVGAPGTPYHDGVFFFDIFFPPEYPNEPPMVHYRSGGLRLNPNLYESGKVCLSLLNTWTGKGSEVWNPNSSSVLQLLVSLQALVLNDKPYFNEAGYDKQIGKTEGEKNSVSYNENAFLLTCRSMIYVLRNPPKHFEAFVEEHFGGRCKNILLACKEYTEGGALGFASCDENGSSSTGFKIMLSKLFDKLVDAFADKGFINCGEFVKTSA